MCKSQKIIIWGFVLIIVWTFFLIELVYADSFKEKDYTNYICNELKGQQEVRTNGVICDCETEEYAYEVDRAHKFYEGISQSLLYAKYLGKDPGLILIIEDFEKEKKYVTRMFEVITYWDLKIRVVFVTPTELEKAGIVSSN